MSKIKLNDVLYETYIGCNRIYVDAEDNHVHVRKDVRKSFINEIHVCAISNLKIVEESKKYFFTITERYYYANKKGGVASDTSYFTLNEDNPDGGVGRSSRNGTVYLTLKEAELHVQHLDEALEENMQEEIKEIKSNLTEVLNKL